MTPDDTVDVDRFERRLLRLRQRRDRAYSSYVNWTNQHHQVIEHSGLHVFEYGKVSRWSAYQALCVEVEEWTAALRNLNLNRKGVPC